MSIELVPMAPADTDDVGHFASIAYALLRQDWESGTVTGFEWEDIHV